MKKTLILITSLLCFSFTTYGDTSYEYDYGRASDCVQVARNTVIGLAEYSGDDVNGSNFEGYLAIYFDLYNECLSN